MARAQPGWKYDPDGEFIEIEAESASDALEKAMKFIPDNILNAITIEVTAANPSSQGIQYTVAIKYA